MVACSKDDDKILASPGRVIKNFKLQEGQYGDAAINVADRKVLVKVISGTDLSALVPDIAISEGATISPASGEKINIAQTLHQTYTITAESGTTAEWKVEFQVISLSVGDYGTYTLSSAAGGNYMGIAGNLLYNEKYDNAAMIELRKAASPTDGINLWQKWHFIYNNSEGDTKYYQIRNLHSGKLLSVPEETDGKVINTVQFSELPAEKDRQLWNVKELTPGVIKILSKLNGLALSNADTSTANGAKVVLEPISDAENQIWRLNPIEEVAYRDDEVVNFFNRNEEYQGSVAFDQGTSVLLSWGPNAGKVLWITQDAWDGQSLQPNDMFMCNHFFSYGNSMFLQASTTNWDNLDAPNITVTNYPNGKPRQIAEIQPGHTFAWPGPGIEIGNKVYIKTGEGIDLTGLEQSFLVLTQNAGLEWTKERVLVPEMSGQDPEVNISYATGMVKPGDGYVYAFGNKSYSFGYRHHVHIARFKETDPLTWTFWDGSEWADSPTIAPEARIGDALGTVAVSYLNGKYILLTMDQGFNCDETRNIYMATADSPTGPFTERKQVYTINEYLNGQYARYYTPSIHPYFDNGRNELLITYSLNYAGCGQNSCNEEGYLDPYYYRIKGVRVPYEAIGL